MNFRLVFTVCLAAAVVTTASAQSFGQARDDERVRVVLRDRIVKTHVIAVVQPDRDPCRDNGWDDDRYRHCEVREESMAGGPVNVDAGRNGGIQVDGWDRGEVQVRAIVTASARTEAEAKQLSTAVQIHVGGGKVAAVGPTTDGRDESWSVSFRINVPRNTDLELNAANGGISIAGVSGTIRFDTTNGGVTLREVAGDVRGETRNGGVTVVLAGDQWQGAGLDVTTTNGGVTVTIPDGYNADFTTRTVNGGFRSDFPLSVQGELSPRQGISTTLGSGGPRVSVQTTNGGVTLRRR